MPHRPQHRTVPGHMHHHDSLTTQVALSREAALQGKVDHRVKEMEGEVAVLRRLSHANIVRYYVGPCSESRQSAGGNCLASSHIFMRAATQTRYADFGLSANQAVRVKAHERQSCGSGHTSAQA